MTVLAASAAGLMLDEPLHPELMPGLRALVREGCDHLLDTCATRFANAANFQGEPFLPGNDHIYRYPPGQPRTVELPAALTAANARLLAERTSTRAGWARGTLAWRTTELDPAIGPGSIVTVPGQLGRWLVGEWEWRDKGVELALTRMSPVTSEAATSGSPPPADPGRSNSPVDAISPPTSLVAFDLPWDGNGSGDTPATFAAVSSAGSNWGGAAIYVDNGDSALVPLGPSGRRRSILGSAIDALPRPARFCSTEHRPSSSN